MTREEALQNIKKAIGFSDTLDESIFTLFPELKESEDEKMIGVIRLALTDVPEERFTTEGTSLSKVLAWIEKQKEASKAIEAVEKIDKYIDEHTINAHDMKDSNPDKRYYSGWDDALGEMAGILQDVYSEKKKKEQNECPEYCVRSHCIGCSIYEKKKESLRDFIDDFPYSAEKEERDWFKKVYVGKSLGEEFEQKEQKPEEWSEKDEKIRKSIIWVLEVTYPSYREEIDWLKSLHPQSKNEWSEEDRFKLEDAITGIDVGIGFYEREGKHPNLLKAIIEAKEWLKSLPERFNLQPKQKWSEEDEDHLKWLCNIIHNFRLHGGLSLKEESELGKWIDKWINH